MFTKTSNFTYGNYRIANIEDEALNNDLELQIHIQKYETECLLLILGKCIYDGLMSNVELDEATSIYKLKANADEKWSWLLFGKSYPNISFCSYNCSTIEWSGLVKKIAKVKSIDIYETIMAPYIFFFWSLNYRTLALGTGEGKGNSEGSTQASAKNKRVDAWNELVQAVSYGFPNGKVSLNQFFEDHELEFPTASKVCLNPMVYDF